MKTLHWDQLLSDFRFRRDGKPAAPTAVDPFRTAFEADYDRIVYSHPFRRLGRKTQVHPLAPNDHVHNRLTHSIEVASVGRSFGKRLGAFLTANQQLPEDRSTSDICQILQAACLVHDIGNPPFGHAGEFAIRHWVTDHPATIFGNGNDLPSAGTIADWKIFEGNAQGFRLAARPDNASAGYLQLTFASLAAMIKYPWDSRDPRAAAQGKFNVFSSEQTLHAEMSQSLGLLRDDGSVARHPLSFLSEAADDICYRILDLEDAVEMRILEPTRVRKVLGQFLDATKHEKLSDAPLPVVRAAVIGTLVDACWHIFQSDYDSIIAGDRITDLKTDFDAKLSDGVGEVKTCYEQIFAHAAKVSAEIGAYQMLGRIIESIAAPCRRLAETQDFSKLNYLEKRRLQLAFGDRFARDHQTQPLDWWLHQLMDFVSGLTDNYASQLSRDIAGLI